MPNENVFREARTMAMHCVYPAQGAILRERADECKEVFDRFNISATREDMELLVARWTRLLIAIKATAPFVSPPPATGGRLPVPRMKAAVG